MGLPLHKLDLSLYRRVQESIDGCVKCGLCLSVCPTFEAILGKDFGGPRYLSVELQRHLVELGRVAYDASYLCTVCRRCEFVCPSGVATPAAVLFLRQLLKQLVPSRDVVGGVAEGLRALIEYGNPYFAESSAREEWLREIGGEAGGKGDVLGWIGCTLSLRLPEVARSFYLFMRRALGEEFVVLGEREGCCGKPAMLLGGREEALELAKRCSRAIEESGARVLVTPCPACYSSFKVEYGEVYGVDLPTSRILHFAEFAKELLDRGRVSLKKPEGVPEVVAYHDPCELGRAMGVFDEPREVLEAVPGIRVVEFDERREDSRCCGGGGMFGIYPEVSMAIAAKRLREALERGASAVVTCCPACIMNFKYAAINYEIPVGVLGLSQVLERALASRA